MIRRTSAALAAAALVSLALPSVASAQAQRIASANLNKVFNEAQETKDLREKFAARGRELEADLQTKKARVTDLKAIRDNLKAGTQDFEKANLEYIKAGTELQIAAQIAQQEALRIQKTQARDMVNRIVAGVKEVAEKEKIAIVFTQVEPPEITDDALQNLNPEQLDGIMRQRNILYVSPETDITSKLIAHLDAKYKQGR